MAEQGWTVGWSCYEDELFVGAVERGGVLACQFHPELSGKGGESLLKRWLNQDVSVLSPSSMDTQSISSSSSLRSTSSSSSLSTASPSSSSPSPSLFRPSLSSRYTPRLIPCLDVKNGRVVKGVKFQSLRDAGDPVECATTYEYQGADELVMLDVSATPEGRNTALQTVRSLRAGLGIALTVGGGVRSIQNAQALLEAGADKVAVNSAAVVRPELISEIAREFGSQCAVVAIDARLLESSASALSSTVSEKKWEVVTQSGQNRTGLDVIEWAKKAVRLGAGEILLTSWDRDGTGEGYDVDLLYALSKEVSVPIIASGGASHAHHMIDALNQGANAVLAASIFHDGVVSIQEVKDQLYSLLDSSKQSTSTVFHPKEL